MFWLVLKINFFLRQFIARDRFPSTSSTEDETGEVEQMMLHHEVEEDGLEHMEGMEVMHQEEDEEDDGMMHNIKYEHDGEHEGEQDESHGECLKTINNT